MCFIASAMLGVYHQNRTWSILVSSILVMILAYLVGLILGAIAQRGVNDHIDSYREQNPMPEEDEPAESETPVSTA